MHLFFLSIPPLLILSPQNGQSIGQDYQGLVLLTPVLSQRPLKEALRPLGYRGLSFDYPLIKLVHEEDKLIIHSPTPLYRVVDDAFLGDFSKKGSTFSVKKVETPPEF